MENLQEQPKKNVIFRIWYALYPILIHFGITQLLAVGIFSAVYFDEVSGGMDNLSTEAFCFYMTVFSVLAAIAAVIGLILYRRDEKRRSASGLAELQLCRRGNMVSAVILSILACAAVGVLLSTLISLMGVAAADEAYRQTSGPAGDDVTVGFILAAQCIVGPIAEEMFFRALVYRRLRDSWGVRISVIVSALIFGIYHMNLTQFIFASVIGILLALLYERYGTIWASIAGHIANNTASTLLAAMVSEDINVILYFIVLIVIAVVSLFMIFRKGFRNVMLF